MRGKHKNLCKYVICHLRSRKISVRSKKIPTVGMKIAVQ